MLEFKTNLNKYESELRDIIRMFIPFFDMDIVISLSLNNTGVCIVQVKQCAVFFEKEYLHFKHMPGLGKEKDNDKEKDKDILVFCKQSLYKALIEFFNKDLPWGSLTGIRPTKMARNYLAAGGTVGGIAAHLKGNYFVSESKAELTERIIKNQAGFIQWPKDYINIYIHIPFCPTRCKYCSFVTLPLGKYGFLTEPYLECLIREIHDLKDLVKDAGKRVLSVYIGGGTPTSLDENQLDRLMAAVDIGGVEYTVEAGRPDTITPSKLNILKQYGATRVCINPQTFCQKTLDLIGRQHVSTMSDIDSGLGDKNSTISGINRAFSLARELNFDINMDLIAGLPGESMDDFEYSLRLSEKFRPENITVHTLSVKNGSDFFNSKQQFNPYTEQMVNFSQEYLSGSSARGYLPYYLYRQKNMSGALENTGFCLPGKQSVNNITVMEETVSVWACGAGAISKKVDGTRIERLANLRDVKLYIEYFDDRLVKKRRFLS